MSILPHHIKQPDQWGYQVCVTIEGKQSSRYFKFGSNTEAGKARALKAALAWRDGILKDHPLVVSNGLRVVPMSHKQSGMPVGITRCVLRGGRKRTSHYLTFAVNYVQNGRTAIFRFWVGNVQTVSAAMERRARDSAIALRKDYEWCRANKKPFDPERFKTWREVVLFPFVPPEDSTQQ